MDNIVFQAMKKFFSFFLAFAMAFVFFVGMSMPASALRLQPTVVEYTVAPGTSQTHSITITNDSEMEMHVAPTVYVVDSINLYGFPHHGTLDQGGAQAQWFSFPADRDLYILKPRKTSTIKVTVSLPASVQPGGYYFSVAWGIAKGESAVTLSETPGVNIAISVLGTVLQKGRVTFFGLANHDSLTSSPIHFTAHIANEGGRHFKPFGRIDIKNIFGITVDHAMLTSFEGAVSWDSAKVRRAHGEQINVLPGATREFYAVWKPAFAFGPYTAVLSVDAEEAGNFSARTSFIVLPSVFLIVSSLLVLILCSMGIFFLQRTVKHLP